MNRTKLEALISAAVTFFGVLLIVAFAIGVSSRGALKGPDAFVLRWTVISLMVSFSALVAWVRWKFFLLPRLSSPSPATIVPSPDILAASRQAIVFRQDFPPPHRESALSFFGGAPVAPRGFRWPRPEGAGAQSKPFSFLMQIDCSEVPAPARLGMLPDRGVLYFFHDLTWGQQDVFATTPDRMLAPPVDVQGYQSDRAKTYLLLLELSSNDGLGHHFGEGVYQFWITPADLRARRFDKVELTADAY